jgi:hypothetical protein
MAKYEIKFWTISKSYDKAIVEAESEREAIKKLEFGDYSEIDEGPQEVEETGGYEVEQLEE